MQQPFFACRDERVHIRQTPYFCHCSIQVPTILALHKGVEIVFCLNSTNWAHTSDLKADPALILPGQKTVCCHSPCKVCYRWRSAAIPDELIATPRSRRLCAGGGHGSLVQIVKRQAVGAPNYEDSMFFRCPCKEIIIQSWGGPDCRGSKSDSRMGGRYGEARS